MGIGMLGSSRFALILACGIAAGSASAQTFSGLGFLPGGTESVALGVSNNGVVTGFAHGPSGFRAFRWTEAVGMEDLGTLVGGSDSSGRAVSVGGSVIAGSSSLTANSSPFHAVRHENGVMTDLGTLPNMFNSFANGVSSNGSVVAGTCRAPGGYSRAFRWVGGVMTDLGTPSGGGWGAIGADGVSGNGAVVVGFAEKSGSPVAFRWTGGKMTTLGKLKGGDASEALDANSDGSVVVGTSDSKMGDRAFRWSGGTMTDLGTVAGQPYSYGTAVSGDGSIVVGYCGDGTTETSPGGAILVTGRAMLYSAATGMVDLNAYLPTYLGIDLTDWELSAARDISEDGKTIVGWGWHYDSMTDTISPEAWIVELP